MTSSSLLRQGEVVLLVTGALLLGVACFKLLRYGAFQARPEWFVAGTEHARTLTPAEVSPYDYFLKKALGPSTGTLRIAGRVEVPRLGMSVLVVDGNEDQGLAVGASHISGLRHLAVRATRVSPGIGTWHSGHCDGSELVTKSVLRPRRRTLTR